MRTQQTNSGPTGLHSIKPPYLLFLGDVDLAIDAKTALGLAYWRPTLCIGEFAFENCPVTCDLPTLTPSEAVRLGARSMIIGVAPAGGAITGSWVETIVQALEAGLDVVAGLHTRLDSIDRLVQTAQKTGQKLIDVRQPDRSFPIGSPRKRSGRRILTVGTDTCVGKKYTALALEKELLSRSYDASFKATGQTGLLIAGRGIVIDAVVSDFLSGAIEMLSPDAGDDHWDIIEGQGSLLHPSHAGVTLGLVHGSQPDYFVLCHVAGSTHIVDWPDVAIPALPDYAAHYRDAARLTNPNAELLGVSLNTSAMPADVARELKASLATQMGVPVVDPLVDGCADLVAELERRETTMARQELATV